MGTWTERNTGLIDKWWLVGTVTDSDVAGVFQFYGAKDQDTALRNWVDPTTPASEIGAPTWARGTGFTFDGVSDAIDVGFALSAAVTVLVLFEMSHDGQNDRMFGNLQGATTTFRLRITKSPSASIAGVIGTAAPAFSPSTSPGVDYTAGGMHDSPTKYVIWDGVRRDPETVGTFEGGGNNSYIGAVNNGGPLASNPWAGSIKACVIYSKALSTSELLQIDANMKGLTATTNLSAYVYWVAQNARTEHLNNANHELLYATEGGLYKTENGGRSSAMLPVPDPSNAEFGDSPAATVDELSFRWVEYDPLEELTYFAMATKASVNRVWLYKSTDAGQTWTSRGVEIA